MKTFLKISRYSYEEPYHLNLIIEASNGQTKGQLEFYINSSDLIDIANILEVFPRRSPDVFLYELGSEKVEDRFAFYLKFRIFTTGWAGHCAIQLRFNNNRDLPDREISEFCFSIEPASLNHLGKLFREFAKMEHEVLYWEPEFSKLYKNRNELDLERE